MNTPAHSVLNLLLLGRKEKPNLALPILLGSALPDAPTVVFYLWAKLVRGLPEQVIWTQAYYAPRWQAVIDLCHSLPLTLLAFAVAWALGAEVWMALFAGMVLHVPEDLFLHSADAHRHFYPFSDWRFHSPVSYWNPRHYGNIAGPLEALLVLVGSAVLLRRFPSPWIRTLLAGVMVLYVFYWGFIRAVGLFWR